MDRSHGRLCRDVWPPPEKTADLKDAQRTGAGMPRASDAYNCRYAFADSALTREEHLKLASIMVAGFAALALCANIAVAAAAPAPAPDEHKGADKSAAHEQWHKQRCAEGVAVMSAHMDYLKAKLDLTAAQRPLWDKWWAVVSDGVAKARAACEKEAAAAPAARPTIVERLAQLQERLAARAANLQAEQPSLAALYEALTPEQRETLERGLAMGMEHGGHGHHGHHGHHCHHGHHGDHGWGHERHGEHEHE